MKTPNPPSTVTIAILTTITIVFWIFYGVYQLLTSTPSTDVPDLLLAPIEPTLDTQTLNQLPSKIYFEKHEFAQLPEFISPPLYDTRDSNKTTSDENDIPSEVNEALDSIEESPEESPGVPEENIN